MSILFCFMCVIVCLTMISPDSFAAEGISSGRRIWDNIMLLVNFGILVFFFVRYAKTPLLNYLGNARKKIEEELNRVDGEVNNAKSVMQSEDERLRDLSERLDEMRESILEMGTREKERIIEEAQVAARKMVDDAELYSRYRLAMAKKALAEEIAEIAVSIAENALKKDFSEEDNEREIDRVLNTLQLSMPNFP